MKKTLKIPNILFRTATIRRDGEGDDAGFTMSICSDEPYLRTDWDGEQYYEMLDHSAGGIDESRLKAGLPILFNHDRDQHLGRAKSYKNDGHKIEVSDIIWSDSDFAQTKKKDAMSGCLPDTSIGYKLMDDGECIGAKDGIPVMKFKSEIHEGSLVTVPADISVGVGRGHSKQEGFRELHIETSLLDIPKNSVTQKKTSHMELKEIPGTQPETFTIENVRDREEDARKALILEQKNKRAKILDFVKALKREDWKGQARELSDSFLDPEDTRSFNDFQTEFWNGANGVIKVETDGKINMDRRELKRYSITELIRQSISGKVDDFYKEKSRDVAAKTRRDPEGIWLPDDVTGSSLQEIHGMGRNQIANETDRIREVARAFSRALNTTDFTHGGALVGTELLTGSLIEILLNKIAFFEGVTYLGGLVGNIAIPRVIGPNVNSYWLPEGGTVTSNDMNFTQLALTPHRLASTMTYDKQLVAQASLSVEALVRDYIARIMAVEKNRAMIAGSGSAGQPLGLFNYPGVQTLTFGTGGSPTWAEIIKFHTVLAQANADIGPTSWVTNPAVQGNLKGTGRALTGANVVVALPVWTDAGTVNGAPADGGVTQNVSSSNLLAYGVGSEFVVADWAGIDIVVNPYSLDTSGQIRVTVQMWTDNGIKHEVAFVISTNAAA